MIIPHIQDRYGKMKEELDLFTEKNEPSVKLLAGSLTIINRCLNELKTFFLTHKFPSPQDEVDFFKYAKPLFYSERIYFLEYFTIDSAVPVGDETLIRLYYEKELAFIQRFFYQYRFLYQYYQVDATELDLLYFTRNGRPKDLLAMGEQEFDSDYSTACDHLFAKFIAYERLQEYLLGCLKNPQGGMLGFSVSKKGRELKWTGDKSNLIELAYGIYDTMQINEGDIDISDIIDWLEQSLQVNLNRYYRRFSEIKTRKSISKTKYLDQMRDALLKHIEEGDAYKPKISSK